MGQEPMQMPTGLKTNNGGLKSPKKQNKQLTIFDRDPRLVEQLLFIPELFAGSIDADIKRVERLADSLPHHLLEINIIDGINERFIKINPSAPESKQTNPSPVPQAGKTRIPSQPHQQTAVVKQQDRQEVINYYELETLERFLDLVKSLQYWYYVEEELSSAMKARKKKKVTIRRKIQPIFTSKLDKTLFSKIFLKFYVIVLKKNIGSKERDRRTLMEDFHSNIGKMICEMLQYNHLSLSKLQELSYKAVYLEKLDTKGNLRRILWALKEEFKPIYLTKEHSIILRPEEYQQIMQTAKCYLDELYLRSLKEAEDPDIIVDEGEGFGVVRNFPVLRVREDRNR